MGNGIAVLLNVTITNTKGQGYLALGPGLPNAVPKGISNINWWDSGLTLANTATVLIGFEVEIGGPPTRQTGIVIGCDGSGSTDYILDVQGYYM